MRFFREIFRREQLPRPQEARHALSAARQERGLEEEDKEVPLRSPEERVLESREVSRRSPLKGGSSMVDFIELKDDGAAVFKSLEGEVSVAEHGTGYRRERAAYLVDLFFGFGLVPPTVIREIEGKIGSVQEFVPDVKAAFEVDNKKRESVNVKNQRALMALFDFIIANQDRYGGNWLLDKNDRIWAIDHGHTFGLRSPAFLSDFAVGIEFDPDTVSKLKSLAASETKKNLLRALLRELLEEREVENCIKRLELVAEAFENNTISNETRLRLLGEAKKL